LTVIMFLVNDERSLQINQYPEVIAVDRVADGCQLMVDIMLVRNTT
jgi:hypothetical protein